MKPLALRDLKFFQMFTYILLHLKHVYVFVYIF